MDVNNIHYEIEDRVVIRLVVVDGDVIADFNPSTRIVNQHDLDNYPLPPEVLAKLTED